jgi:hypothetical protein
MATELIHPWIAQVLGVCLSFYLGESPESKIEVEDDGTSLHFHVEGLATTAIVAEVSNPVSVELFKSEDH